MLIARGTHGKTKRIVPTLLTFLGRLPTCRRELNGFAFAPGAGRDPVEDERQESAEDALYAEDLVPGPSQVLYHEGRAHRGGKVGERKNRECDDTNTLP